MTKNFHNISSERLADEYGHLSLQAKAIEERMKNIKNELIQRDIVSIKGGKYSLTISEQISIRLDMKKIKEFLGSDSCKDFEIISTSMVVRIKSSLPEIKVMEAA